MRSSRQRCPWRPAVVLQVALWRCAVSRLRRRRMFPVWVVTPEGSGGGRGVLCVIISSKTLRSPVCLSLADGSGLACCTG